MSPSLYIEFRSTNAVLRRGTAMEEKAMPSVWSTKPWVGDAVSCPKHSKKIARKNTNGKSEKKGTAQSTHGNEKWSFLKGLLYYITFECF